MSNSHESVVSADRPIEDIERIVSAVAASLERDLRWRRVRPEARRQTLRVRMNWRSWGEVVSITPEPRSVRIRSRCVSPFQILDFGKNRANVNKVRERLEAAVAEEAPAAQSG